LTDQQKDGIAPMLQPHHRGSDFTVPDSWNGVDRGEKAGQASAQQWNFCLFRITERLLNE